MSSEKKLFPHGPDRIKIHVPKDMTVKPYIEYYDEDGKRQRLYRGLSRPVTYKGRLAAAQALLETICVGWQPRRSIEDRAWDYIQEKKKEWRRKTYLCYCSKLRNFLRWKKKRPLSRELVLDFFDHLDDRVSKGTRNDYLRYLKQIFTAIGEESAFDGLNKLRHKAQTKRHYQARHMRMIKEYLAEEDPELLFMCQCIYFLLARPNSELRLLKVMHFEVDDGRVFIPAHIAKNKEDGYVRIAKVFMPYVLKYLEGKRPNEYVFPSRKNIQKPAGYNTMLTRYRRHLNTLGFGLEYSLYGWKNSGNVALVKAGVHVEYIRKQNRHSTLEMTTRYLRSIGFDDAGNLEDLYPDF